MKRKILIIAFVCLSLLVKGQDQVKIGHADTIYSEILKEKRPILVYSPNFDTSYFSRPQFPVLYVLDGNGYFDNLVTMIRQLAVIDGNTALPEMIIVGIENTRGHRTRNLTPSNSAMDKLSGGGENFTAFMEKELIPYIDKNYATAQYRVLAGHSLGGLMVINTLLNHTGLFNAYLALDPSMSYNNEDMLKQVVAKLAEKDMKGKILFLGIGNTMDPGMDTSQMRTDTTEITHHIRTIFKLKDNLKRNAAAIGLRWNYKYYPDDDHNSMALISEYDGLRFVFYSNRFPRNQPQIQFMDKTLSAEQLKNLIDAHYKLVSDERGYAVKPQEALINQFGYIFLQQKDFERSKMFFQINIDYFPNNFNTYDGMGDCYLAMNDKTTAIRYFKKALSLKFRPDIKEKLDKVVSNK
jgi:predicted alpha/beta superfamily hydrolase